MVVTLALLVAGGILLALLIFVILMQSRAIKDLRQDRADLREERSHMIAQVNRMSGELADLRHYIHGRLAEPDYPQAIPEQGGEVLPSQRKFKVIDGFGGLGTLALLWKVYPKLSAGAVAVASAGVVLTGAWLPAPSGTTGQHANPHAAVGSATPGPQPSPAADTPAPPVPPLVTPTQESIHPKLTQDPAQLATEKGTKLPQQHPGQQNKQATPSTGTRPPATQPPATQTQPPATQTPPPATAPPGTTGPEAKPAAQCGVTVPLGPLGDLGLLCA